MAGLNVIKKRINTVQSIRKITHAMELVAASKLKRAKNEYDTVKAYEESIVNTFNLIINHLTHSEAVKLFPVINAKARLFIVLTGDFGLAGSYNANVIKLAKKTIKKDDLIILIGSKGIHALESLYPNQILATLNSEQNEDHYQMMQDVMKVVYEHYSLKEVNSVNIIYNKYINNLVQEEISEQIMPITIGKLGLVCENGSCDKSLTSTIEFEPSPRQVLSTAIPLYLTSQLYKAYSSAKLSELASRRSAMETATDNADNLTTDLNIKYNRRRQSNITQELNEIVAGADAV
ncbi:ATP synthase F1 subunit gamma [Mycoplasmopsis gallinarum]|uniref:ATP synthase F1 subunit gamma n=1 Tax=Mycoplasmopsis gallinarum TaxID=29557 RepID=UPI000484A18D|nr:ATP synthase F1 subunit gamma [Mycoplasmopsis gallinarum]